MAAYVISERYGEVANAEDLRTYAAVTGRLISEHGGRYLTVSRHNVLLEGKEVPLVVGIVEFPSMAHVEAWWNSEAYQAVAPLRRSAEMRIIAADGVIPPHAVMPVPADQPAAPETACPRLQER